MNRVEELEKILREADDAYYGIDKEPIMNDDVYNILYDELKKIQPDSDIIRKVNTSTDLGNKIKHKVKMLSLRKPKKDKLETITKLLEHGDLVGSLKADGMSIQFTFENGNLIEAVTRGDGEYGIDVTKQMKKSKYNKVSNLTAIVRGELVIHKSDFETLIKLYKSKNLEPPKNLRNCINGIIQREFTHLLTFKLFDVLEDSNTYIDKINKYDMFDNTGQTLLTTKEEIKEYIDSYEQLSDINYLIDGLVFRINNEKTWDDLGSTAKYPLGSIVFKPSDNTFKAVVDYIDVVTNRTGKVSYTAVFKEPVVIENSEIRRATLHNYGIVETKQIRSGTVVNIKKANGVIPYVSSVVSQPKNPFKIDSVCTSCGHELTIEINEKTNTKEAYCTNPNCEAQKEARFVHACNVLDIDGLREKTAEKVRNYMITEFDDNPLFVYALSLEDLLSIEGFKRKSATNLYHSIRNKSNVKINKFIQSLGIKNIGADVCKKICTKYSTYGDWFGELSFENIDGIGEVIKNTLYTNIDYIREQMVLFTEELNMLLDDDNRVSIEPYEINKDTTYAGLSIVVTGSFPQSRSNIKKWLTSKGCNCPSAVSGKTNYLVCGKSSGVNKVNKAKLLGVPMVSNKIRGRLSELFEWVYGE